MLAFAVVAALLGGAGCGGCGGGDAAIDGGGGGACSTSDDCEGGQVCQPSSQTCEEPGAPCATHADCDGGTYCEPTADVCLPSSTGSPCESADNCEAGGECFAGFCGCDGLAQQRDLEGGALDVYLVLDRTGSMGTDCAYDPVNDPTPPVASKACYATYALADYLVDVTPEADTRLAFNVMSLSNDCTGADYDPALIGMTELPVAEDSALVQRISDEDFSGGFGTRIEGALRGIAGFTSNNQTDGREMIGVLITDGDATNCETDTGDLAQIIADHLAATAIRTFIIGMDGADEATLETLAVAGGAEAHDDFCGGLTPPCHFWSVGDGSGSALASALQAIADQSTPLACDIDVTGLTPPEGEDLDYTKINVTLSQDGTATTIGQVASESACPTDADAWYYDDPAAPTTIHLCEAACELVTAAGDGAQLSVVVGCGSTVVVE
jgi:hypothetical protein